MTGPLLKRITPRWWRLMLTACAVALAAAAAPATRQQIGDLLLEDIPAEAESYGRAVADYVDTRPSYEMLNWRLGASGYTFLRLGNLYTAETPHGPFRQAVDLPERIENPRPAQVCGEPGFLFTRDEDGDEYDAVFAAKAVRGAFVAHEISPSGTRNATVRTNPDGSLVAYASARRGAGAWELIVQAPCQGAARRVRDRSNYQPYIEDFGAGNQLLISRQADTGHVLYTIDGGSGVSRSLLHLAEPVRQGFLVGQRVLFTTNAFGEYVELYSADFANAQPRRLLGGLGHDIEQIILSPDRRKLAIILNEGVADSIAILDLATGHVQGGGFSAPLGVIADARFTHDGAALALSLSRNGHPSENGVYDWRTGTFTPWSGGVEPQSAARIATPIEFTYPSFDRVNGSARQIPALIYLPLGASAETPAPVLIAAHGGPASQSRPSFNRLYNYYVMEMGVAVVQPNIRGSTGYGRAFEQLDDGERRGDAIKDIGALLEWIEAEPNLDASRVVIAGGSYGGYVAMASLATYPDRIRGGISRVGVTDIATFLQNTEPYRLANRRLEYGDERDPLMAAQMALISPLQRAHEIHRPVLIIQGANDPRVPEQQAEAMVAAVRQNGVRAGYLLAGDEGHRFENATNRRWRDGAQVEFVRRVLLSDN
jgi:dipeptidyl aminopeptidase/acylaminoacyl peptidase